MSAAARICEYLKTNGRATRPELQRELDLGEKTVETAIRKLARLQFVADTGRKRREGSPRLAAIYAPGIKEFSQHEFSRGIFAGRPGGAPRQRHSFEALTGAMSAFFGGIAA
ncbi:hypothetical protein R69746_05633 [Paraburkholderia aspalathi]|uniref:hypothetical protein n=1 Tax=Paraburkholderia aspalathi TaxID=1324617 RepID=UPI001909ABDA|nr:hypothetical protein [Paraburkholderia aspalathi]MBK3841744.1 hypothetical protein [Paraburkholderia aspalathi]CAE6811320.1 hypothetical protein R69746_05633 [Paraburkholderia aspalathi]